MTQQIPLFVSLLLLLAPWTTGRAKEVRDERSVAIAESMMRAMGGPDAWMRARFVRYDFRVNAGGKEVVRRSHLWDKQSGRYRIDGKTRDGRATVAIFDAGTRDGKAYVAGQELQGTAAAEALKNAYGSFINDMYWLAMPWKWLDPGVNLKYLGTRKRGTQSYDVVELSFSQVGLTPGDRYEAYVSPRSHLMEHWEYTLQSGNEGSWDWEYVKTHGVLLAQNHVSPDGKTIHMGDVRVSDAVDEALFRDPKKALP